MNSARDAAAAVLHREAEVAVVLLGPHGHRRRAVAERVRDEVRHDALERGAVCDGDRLLGDIDVDGVGSGATVR